MLLIGLISTALLWGIQHVDLAHWTYCFLYVHAHLLRIQTYRQRRERERMEQFRNSLINDPKFVAFVTDHANRAVNSRMLNAEIARRRGDLQRRRNFGSNAQTTAASQTTVGEWLARHLLKMN